MEYSKFEIVEELNKRAYEGEVDRRERLRRMNYRELIELLAEIET